MRRFCEVFLFEDVPAQDRRADNLYLNEVNRCTVYIGLLGVKYGNELSDGLSPTHKEFQLATESKKYRLVFVKGDNALKREPKMASLIQEAESHLIRRRFVTLSELITGVYASLVEYLSDQGLLRFGPFDADICEEATFEDLSADKIRWFFRRARDARAFPLDESATLEDVLAQLRLTRKGKLTNAAVLLFAKEPQRFIYSSEIKCAHFHGTAVQKPIPFYQVYKGNLFDLIDQSVNFVLSKIDLAVGTRANGPVVPVSYEIPPEVITEAIVNAVAHRDYSSTGSVQVMLFSDRLEVWNPGTLTSALTLESLRKPHGSYPPNPLLAEPLYLTKYIERMGTGIPDMVDRCRKFGLPSPEFSLTDSFVTTIWRKKDIAFHTVGTANQFAVGVESGVGLGVESKMTKKILILLEEEPLSKSEIALKLGKKKPNRTINELMNQLLKQGFCLYTLPDKPSSRLQKYRLTEAGKKAILRLSTEKTKAGQVGGQVAGKRGQVRGQVWGQVAKKGGQVEGQVKLNATERMILAALQIGPMASGDLGKVEYGQLTGSFKKTLDRLLIEGLIEYTIPEKPRSSKQKYCRSKNGKFIYQKFSSDISKASSKSTVRENAAPTYQGLKKNTLQVTSQVKQLIIGIKGEKSREELQAILKLKDRIAFVEKYLKPALAIYLIERTIPDKPNSRLQKYRLTAKGKKERLKHEK